MGEGVWGRSRRGGGGGIRDSCGGAGGFRWRPRGAGRGRLVAHPRIDARARGGVRRSLSRAGGRARRRERRASVRRRTCAARRTGARARGASLEAGLGGPPGWQTLASTKLLAQTASPSDESAEALAHAAGAKGPFGGCGSAVVRATRSAPRRAGVTSFLPSLFKARAPRTREKAARPGSHVDSRIDGRKRSTGKDESSPHTPAARLASADRDDRPPRSFVVNSRALTPADQIAARVCPRSAPRSGDPRAMASLASPPTKDLRNHWSKEEHAQFLQGVAAHGRGEWAAIARDFVPTRTGTQVCNHGQKYFAKLDRDRGVASISGGASAPARASLAERSGSATEKQSSVDRPGTLPARLQRLRPPPKVHRHVAPRGTHRDRDRDRNRHPRRRRARGCEPAREARARAWVRDASVAVGDAATSTAASPSVTLYGETHDAIPPGGSIVDALTTPGVSACPPATRSYLGGARGGGDLAKVCAGARTRCSKATAPGERERFRQARVGRGRRRRR